MKRIKYVSHFAEPLSKEVIDDIALASERNNMEHGITGILVATGGLFFQILEGPAESVDRTFDSICADPRHKDVILLSSETKVKNRLYPDWAMKTLSLEASTETRLAPLRALIETVYLQGEHIGKLMRTIERSVWEEIAHSSARFEPSD